MRIKKTVNIIGAGFAGIESALLLASHGIKVHIFDLGESYKCDCTPCELFGKNLKTEHYARSLLREELEILKSPLIEIEEKFHKKGLIECGCLASRVLEEGKRLLKNNENIQYFNVNVKEIDLDEINLIACGPHMKGELFEWLKKHYGSMRCQEGLYESPVVDKVDESLLFKKEDDESGDLYYPFDYDEYIEFVNRIVKAHNDCLDLRGTTKLEGGMNSIEKLIEKDKNALKNQVLRPCKLEGFKGRPYAVLKVKRVPMGYQLCGLASSMPFILQDMVFTSLKPFKGAKLVDEARVLQNIYINSSYVINEFMQSVKDERVFFAGGLTGTEGHLEAMATGLMAAYSIICYIYGKRFVNLPIGTCIGSISRKIISTNASNSSPLVATYDIIEGNKEKRFDEEFKKTCSLRSKEALSYYLEEIYGRNKI